LAWRIRQIVPCADLINVCPVETTSTTEDMQRTYILEVQDSQGAMLTLGCEIPTRIVSLLQSAHPEADWSRPVSWRADGEAVTPAPGGEAP
jgi:hypothetical protein